MKRHVAGILLILCLPVFLFAEEPLEMSSKYLGVTMNPSPIISGGYFLQKNLALEAGVGFAFSGEENANGLAIRLGLDKYLGKGHLVPFLGAFTRFDINPNAVNNADWKGSRLTLGGHWGLNYFIFEQLSVAATFGAQLQMNSPKNKNSSTNFSSFTSGIQLRFFF